MQQETLTTDANLALSKSRTTHKSISFTLQQVVKVEEALDLVEKISLVYLLYQQNEIALEYVIQLLKNNRLEVVVEWAKQAVTTNNWNEKLIEALSIIQNFYIIEKLGYEKKEICDRFLPMNSNTSLFIELHKKKLYRICETMTNNQMRIFLSHVEKDLNEKKLAYKPFPLPYIECYFLHWQSIGYISSSNLTNIGKAFKVMEMYELADNLMESYKLRVKNNTGPNLGVVNKELTLDREDGAFTSLSSVGSTSVQDRVWNMTYEDKSYIIDPQLPGICFIINQENFYTEPDPQWSHLLPKADIQLLNRDGTTFDRDNLKTTFESFGYTIVIKNNLTHQEVLDAIIEAVNMVQNHSSLIICILSHGLEGRVYGVNSIPVDINKIRNAICTTNTKNLKMKPKVLILQACQGTECQLVSDDEDDEPPRTTVSIKHTKTKEPQTTTRLQYDNENLEMDGGSRPKTADMLLFWATVPGYGAIRDTTKGSWFIQSLCSHIQQRAHEMHFEDICTLVKQEVIDKRWKTNKNTRVMVPNKESTLSRFFFLPPFKNTSRN